MFIKALAFLDVMCGLKFSMCTCCHFNKTKILYLTIFNKITASILLNVILTINKLLITLNILYLK